MARVFVTYKIPEKGIALLREAGHTVDMWEKEELINREQLIKAVGEYDALLCLLTEQIDAEVLAAAGSNLKVIANYAVGFNNIDVKAAQEKGIVITNTPEVLTGAVAEHTMTLIAALSRRVVEADRFVREGKYEGWRPMLFLGTDLSNKTLGVVGLGRIGSELARRAKLGFEMKIAYNDLQPNEEFETAVSATFYESLDDLLREADVISLHVPLLPTTTHLINDEHLHMMKETAFLVNTSRGPVVDEEALVAALQNRVIAGAALDVFEQEPDVTPGLAELPNVILTPHIASATIETRNDMSELAAKNIAAVLSGQEPLTPV